MNPPLNMVAQYSASSDLLFEATVAALGRFADLLEDDSLETDFELVVPAEPVAASYEGFLTALHLVKVEGQAGLKIYRERNVLIISGGLANSSTFAANIRFLQEEALSRPSMQSVLHLHIEYYPDHPYLDPNSDPLVIYIKKGS